MDDNDATQCSIGGTKSTLYTTSVPTMRSYGGFTVDDDDEEEEDDEEDEEDDEDEEGGGYWVQSRTKCLDEKQEIRRSHLLVCN